MSLMTTKKLSTTLLLFMLLPVATLLTSILEEDKNNHNNNNNNNNQYFKEKQKDEQQLSKSLSFQLIRNVSNTILDVKRSKRYTSSSNEPHPQPTQFDQKFSLPAVPLPPPPPYPSGTHNFGLNAFTGVGSGKIAFPQIPNAFGNAGASAGRNSNAQHNNCGGIYKTRYGVIQTPNFPHKYTTPIECVWIIDASELPSIPNYGGFSTSSSTVANVSIVVYLTQLYVLGGLTFTEYMYYSDDFKVPAQRVVTLTDDEVTQLTWLQFNSKYLEIRFLMPTLDGTHLRALDRLLDVYGFNITYEVQNEVKPYQCNTLQCRFLGHCYASADFGSYSCACFPGFSGSDCGHGPLCEDPHTNVCQNGGTCKHIGDAAITCHCPLGFKGTKCEIPEINATTLGCTANSSSSNCHRECEFGTSNEIYSPFKSNRPSTRTGKTRYEVTIRLGNNLTAFYRNSDTDRRASDHLPGFLEKHLMRVLRNFNITKISDLELISNTTDRLDITFHFFGIKADSNRIREAITRMVERGRIGNITLVANYQLFDENPPLNLFELTVNQPSAVREDSEFIISCTAQGSPRMQFQWYKDGSIVNASRATREIWTTVLPPESKDVYTAILGVTKASRIDEGIYTCKVTDWGVEQCRSLHIHIKSPPRLRVDPASVTLHRGDSLRVRCLSPDNDDIKRYAQLGYSWTRNGVLFQSNPATAMWEDLYPDGSILKINNIQKSAEYACLVSNTVKPVSKSVYINVIERSAVHVCHTETSYGVRWPTSAPGAPIASDCPRGYEGHSQRICEQRDTGNSSWLLPDFSLCIRDELLVIYNRFRALSAGFQQTNSSNILKSCFDYTIKSYKNFLPGEAGFLIDMLHELDIYLQLKGTQLEREMAAEIILHILDKVMQNAQSLNSQQQIKKLQLLTQSAALNRETIAASQLATSTSGAGNILQASISSAASSAASGSVSSSSSSSGVASSSLAGNSAATVTTSLSTATSSSSSSTNSKSQTRNSNDAGVVTVDEETLSLDRLNSLRIYMTSVKTLPFNLRIYGDDLFSDQLYMDIGLSPRLLHIMANSTIFASVISYKNLKSFLPKTYYTRGSDPKDKDYVLASRIIQTWLFQSNRSNDNIREPLDLPFEAGHVEIIFQHETVSKDSNWVAICGHDYKASFESTWRSDLCITKHLMENITRCICPLSGTYVVMLTKRQQNFSPPNPPQSPVFVIVSCACCLLQSCSAFLILLPIWCNRKCAITFLKMQFCVSTSSIMLIFLLGFLKMLPVNWHAIISSSLASLLLLGVSTLIAIALVIHTELVPKKYLQINANKPSTVSTAANLQTAAKRRSSANIIGTVTGSGAGAAAGTTTSVSGSGETLDVGTNISLTNITQISHSSNSQMVSNSTLHRGTTGRRGLRGQLAQRNLVELPSAGIRGAIGISWLLPLLFAIAGPLICSIIGKWPRNWWLEIMSKSMELTQADAILAEDDSGDGGSSRYESLYYATHQLLNGDNLLLETSNTTATAATTNLETATSTVAAWHTSTTAAAAAASTLSYSTSATLSALPVYASPETTYGSAASLKPLAAAWSAAETYSASTLSNIETEAEIMHAAAAAALTTSTAELNAADVGVGVASSAAASVGSDDGAGGGIESGHNASTTASLNFILFICVDLLFILLFFALFAILMKKLLWLSHKNRNIHTHPLDKFNMAMRRRLGLLYRTGCLLLIKLSTDGFFIAYVNTTIVEDSWWCYPFGICSILLGFAILFCFVIKPESQLRGPTFSNNGSTGSSNSGTLKKKFSTSKTSLDENYCTGTINSPLSFYTNQEKEKESECGAPTNAPHEKQQQKQQQLPQKQGLELSGAGAGEQLPLTIISTAPRCQMAPVTHASNVETFLGTATLERKAMGGVTLHALGAGTGGGVASPASRCCALLGSSMGMGSSNTAGGMGATQTLPTGMTLSGIGGSGYYDAYGGLAVSMTGSLSRRALHQQQHHHQAPHDFIGVDTLDILQGVAADSIIGIRTSNMLPAQFHHHHHHHSTQQQPILAATLQHNPYVDATTYMPPPPPPTIVSISGITVGYNSGNSSNATTTTTTTSSMATQTPKSQKRVTIMEPTTHTFDPMLPTMVAASQHATVIGTTSATTTTTATANKTYTETCSAPTAGVGATTTAAATAANKTDVGMLDRITHDLEYLLNHSSIDDADDIPPPPLPPSSNIPTGNADTQQQRQHDVIMEETEPET